MDVNPGEKVGKTIEAKNDASRWTSLNDKEDAIVEAIDQRAFLSHYATWIDKLRKGEIDVVSSLSEMSPDMLVRLAFLAIAGNSDKIKLAAIQDWLDRAGYSKVQKFAGVVDANTPKEQLIAMITGMAQKTKAIDVTDDDDK